VVLDMRLDADLINQHVLSILDALLAVFHNAYPNLLDIRIEPNQLLVLKQKDSGQQMRILAAVQRSWDEANT
jgi:hypothetical protein